MSEEEDAPRDLGALVVAPVGSVVETGDLWEPYQIVGPSGDPVAAVVAYLGELQAAGRSESTQRSYAMALLRWFRFLWTVDVDWNRATRFEARDFARWIQLASKPVRPHWRSPDKPPAAISRDAAVPDTVAGKRRVERGYASATIAHCETVVRSFYGYHLEAGTGPLVNPFPLARLGRAHAHHNPMERFEPQRAGRYRPRQVKRVPRQIPDEVFNELFARLRSDGTVRSWRSGCRRVPARRSCWACCVQVRISGSN
jgi:hypothetical protein